MFVMATSSCKDMHFADLVTFFEIHDSQFVIFHDCKTRSRTGHNLSTRCRISQLSFERRRRSRSRCSKREHRGKENRVCQQNKLFFAFDGLKTTRHATNDVSSKSSVYKIGRGAQQPIVLFALHRRMENKTFPKFRWSSQTQMFSFVQK